MGAGAARKKPAGWAVLYGPAELEYRQRLEPVLHMFHWHLHLSEESARLGWHKLARGDERRAIRYWTKAKG